MPIKESTIVDIREEMARLAIEKRYSVREIAKMFGVTRPTVRKWGARLRELGRSGLEDRSHAPKTCPHKTDTEAERLILEDRNLWGWGSKKILERLAESHPELVLPARSTADAILSRYGLVKSMRAPRERALVPFAHRYVATQPGELTTMDHKGEFRLLNGRYVHPLTIMDHFSRYIQACEALDSTSFARAWPVIERVFREHGLPLAAQTDNGPPFGAPSGGRFSRLSVELMSLGVQPVFSRPGVPQDNGSHERMHRDLKYDTARMPALCPVSKHSSTRSFTNTMSSVPMRDSECSDPRESTNHRRVPSPDADHVRSIQLTGRSELSAPPARSSGERIRCS